MADKHGALPANLASKEHLNAIEETMVHLLTDLDAEKCLVYLIDTVSEQALPFLAEQFDVLGYKGWKIAKTDAERREVIKSAIQIKKYMGTVWAIEQAMIATGYGGALLVEGVPDPVTPNPAVDWANFTILVDLGNNGGLDNTTPTELFNLVKKYKPARCRLIGISFTASIREDIPFLQDNVLDYQYHADVAEIMLFPDQRYDNTLVADGSMQYRSKTEALNYIII